MLNLIPDIIKVPVIVFVFYILGEPGQFLGWYQKLIGRLPEVLWKPLGGCLECVTGQVCFWFYLIKNFYSYQLTIEGVTNHLFFVSFGILFTITLKYLYDFTQEN